MTKPSPPLGERYGHIVRGDRRRRRGRRAHGLTRDDHSFDPLGMSVRSSQHAAIVIGLLGYGMWTLRNWARLITMIIASLSLAGTIVSLVQIGSELDSSTILLGLVRVGVCVLILWYLTRPGIRSTFRSRAKRTEL